jgi:hypothetical protein
MAVCLTVDYTEAVILEEIFRPPTDEGVEKKATVTIVVEDDTPER